MVFLQMLTANMAYTVCLSLAIHSDLGSELSRSTSRIDLGVAIVVHYA